MSTENLKEEAQKEAKLIASVAKAEGFGRPEVLAAKNTRDASPYLMELMNEHGLGIGLHKGVNAPDVVPVANGYTRMVEDLAKAHTITMNAEKEHNSVKVAQVRATQANGR